MQNNSKRIRVIEMLIFIIIFIIVFFTPNMISYLKINYFSSILDINKVADISVESPKGMSVYDYKGHIVLATAEQLTVFDKRGNKVTQRQLFGNQSMVRVQGDTLIIAETDRGEIATLQGVDLKYNNHRKDMGAIENILIAGEDKIIVEMAENNEFQILDNTLTTTARFTIPAGEITALNLSEDGKVVLISVIDIENYKFNSYVYQYDLDGNTIGSSDLEGDLIFSSYMNRNQVIVTDSKLKSYDRASEKVAEIEGMSKIDQSTMHHNFLYASFTQKNEDNIEQPLLSIYSDDFSYVDTSPLVALPEGIVVSDKFIVTFAEGVIYVYDHSMNSLANIRTERTINGVRWLDQTHLISYDASQISVYVLE